MKPHPRIRKTIKWGGAAVTVLLVVTWIVSLWVAVGCNWKNGRSVDVFRGIINTEHLGTLPIGYKPGMHAESLRTAALSPYWRCGWGTIGPSRCFFVGVYFDSRPHNRGITIVLWFPIVVALAITGWAWRLDWIARRRALLNLCPKCNYDRAGLAPGAVCPECGSPPHACPSP